MTNVMHKIFSMYLFLFTTLYMFRAHPAQHQEWQFVSIQPPVTVILCWWPRRLQVVRKTCTHLGHQHRMTVTRGCIDTICPSWWWSRCARNMWRVINRSKYIENNLCKSCSFTKNHYMMHSQESVKFCQQRCILRNRRGFCCVCKFVYNSYYLFFY